MPEVTVPPEMIPQLKKLWNAGLSALECGQEIGLVGDPTEIREAVIRAHQAPASKVAAAPKPAQQPKPPSVDSRWSEERIKMLKLLRSVGASGQAISEALSSEFPHLDPLSRDAVLAKCRKLGLPMISTERRTGDNVQRAKLSKTIERGTEQWIEPDGIDGAPPPEDLEIPVEQRRSLLGQPHSGYPEITLTECLWPVGDPRDVGFFFCGAPRHGDHRYCAHHRRRSVAKPTGPTRVNYFSLRNAS